MKRIRLPIILCFTFVAWLAGGLSAQEDSLVLTKNFQFKDGIYLSFSDFQKNKPSYQWEEVKASVFSNPQNFMTQVEFIKEGLEDDAADLDLEKIWGICLGGIPYIRLEEGAVKKSLTVFAGLRLRGKICYFNYEDEVIKKVEMPVYNPRYKYVFRTAWVERKELVLYQKMLHFETGKIEDFTIEHFKTWISDDSRLVKSIAEMSAEELDQKLFKCLLIYVDRNQVSIFD